MSEVKLVSAKELLSELGAASVDEQFTKVHFEAIASIIRNSRLSLNDKRGIAEDFASYFSGTSPAFDRSRFLAACGV